MFQGQLVQEPVSHLSSDAIQRRSSWGDGYRLEQLTANVVDPIEFTVTFSVDFSVR